MADFRKEIWIAGRPVELTRRDMSQLMHVVAVAAEVELYDYYEAVWNGTRMLLAEPKTAAGTPKELQRFARSMQAVTGMTVAFVLAQGRYYLRERLVDKGVYFVIDRKYAFLPTLYANERVRKSKRATRLSPAAQYLLLYHLQVHSLEGFSARDLKDNMPYSYSTLALAMTCLEDLGLCRREAEGPRRKVLRFGLRGKELWQQAQPVLVSPVVRRVFCDELRTEQCFTLAGANGRRELTGGGDAHGKVMAVSRERLTELTDKRLIVNPNAFDGEFCFEVWRYSPVTKRGFEGPAADALSLAIELGGAGGDELVRSVVWKD